MKKLALFIPYLDGGTNPVLPKHMPAFFRGIEGCKDIDFYIITDMARPSLLAADGSVIWYDAAPNLHFVNETVGGFEKRVLDKLNISFTFKDPDKVADFKPMLGELYSEILEDYEYWGWTSFETIFGAFSEYLQVLFSRNYDIILPHMYNDNSGLVILRNSKQLNNLYKLIPKLKFSDVEHYQDLLCTRGMRYCKWKLIEWKEKEYTWESLLKYPPLGLSSEIFYRMMENPKWYMRPWLMGEINRILGLDLKETDYQNTPVDSWLNLKIKKYIGNPKYTHPMIEDKAWHSFWGRDDLFGCFWRDGKTFLNAEEVPWIDLTGLVDKEFFKEVNFKFIDDVSYFDIKKEGLYKKA